MFYAAFHSHSYPLQTSTEAQFRTLVATLEVGRKYSFRSPFLLPFSSLRNYKIISKRHHSLSDYFP